MAGRAFTRICGSGPATDAGQTGKVGIDAEASPGASAGTEGLVGLEVLDTAPGMLEVGVTSALLLGDAVWFIGDLGGVGPAVFRSTLNPGRRKNDSVVDGIQTWTSMLYTGCPAIWNSLIGIEFGTSFDEFLISVNFSNPRSICYCDYRGCPTHIISGPPEKCFVVSSSTTATGPFHSTCPVRSWQRPLILGSIQSCGTSRHFRTATP